MKEWILLAFCMLLPMTSCRHPDLSDTPPPKRLALVITDNDYCPPLAPSLEEKVDKAHNVFTGQVEHVSFENGSLRVDNICYLFVGNTRYYKGKLSNKEIITVAFSNKAVEETLDAQGNVTYCPYKKGKSYLFITGGSNERNGIFTRYPCFPIIELQTPKAEKKLWLIKKHLNLGTDGAARGYIRQ